MDFYLSATILIELLMLTMIVHVAMYSGFTKQQKFWYIATFVSIVVCSLAEYAVHCGYYDVKFKIPLTIITVIQFSTSPLLAVFFSGALGIHKESKRALLVFLTGAIVQFILAFFGSVFYFDEAGYHRGSAFLVYEIYYFAGLLFLVVSMIIAGKRFQQRDIVTIIMILVILIGGILPMTFQQIHIAYISIAIASCVCYIYYNDLVQEDIKIELINKEKKVNDMQTHIISGLANLVESRDTSTGEHVARTSDYSRKLAQKALDEGVYTEEINQDFVDLMFTLSPMHDVGKILVPDQILKKPGRLTQEEFETIKIHAEKGGVVVRKILEGITDENYVNFAADIATYHHEWWNGKGYPMGLAGEEIPLCARIMAISDVYDALTSERCYKKAYPKEQAIEIIKSESGTHFDPKLVDIFLKCVEA